MKTITVIIVSYNQEDVISRCLDSILIQKDYGLKHIVVCDDCSKDHTWDVLQIYQEKYPEILKIYRNERNLGIYPNMEKAVSLRGEADLYHQLAGDDALCDGWFKNIQAFILEKDIDFSVPIGIYSDWKSVNEHGTEARHYQDFVLSSYDLFSLCIRGKICGRSLLVNEEVISRYSPLPKEKEHNLNLMESVYDSQDHRLISRAYYLPYVGSIYYSGIGISVSLGISNSDYSTIQEIEKWEYFRDNFINNSNDLYLSRFSLGKVAFIMHPSIVKIPVLLYYFYRSTMKGIDDSMGDFLNIFLLLTKYYIKCVFHISK